MALSKIPPSATQPFLNSSQPTEIIPSLNLSSLSTTIPAEYTHILNICLTATPPAAHNPLTLHIPLLDLNNLTPHIPSIIQFLDAALQDPSHRILIHCALDINRSAAAVTAYPCHRDGVDAPTVVRFLKSRKPDVDPSVLFLRQIDEVFGRGDGKVKDPFVGFHERLRRRKAWVAGVVRAGELRRCVMDCLEQTI